MTERVNRETGQVGWPDLVELARRFPTDLVEQKDGQDYVAHHAITQRLLSVVGPFDFQLVEILRSDVPAVAPDPQGRSRRAKAGTPALHQVVTGAVWRLSCEVDGRRTQVEEVGDTDPHNWPTDGARLKDAASDALKRAAMRLGLGLHLWAQEHYFLDVQLAPLTSRSAAAAKADPPQQQPLLQPEPQSEVLSPQEAAHRGMQFQAGAQQRGREQPRPPAGLGRSADPAWAGKDGRQ